MNRISSLPAVSQFLQTAPVALDRLSQSLAQLSDRMGMTPQSSLNQNTLSASLQGVMDMNQFFGFQAEGKLRPQDSGAHQLAFQFQESLPQKLLDYGESNRSPKERPDRYDEAGEFLQEVLPKGDLSRYRSAYQKPVELEAYALVGEVDWEMTGAGGYDGIAPPDFATELGAQILHELRKIR